MKPLETPEDPIFTMISPPWPSKSTMFICLLVGLLGSHHFYVAAYLIIQKEAFLWRWLTSSEPIVNNGQIYHDMFLIIVYYIIVPQKIQLQSSLRTSVAFFTLLKNDLCVFGSQKKSGHPSKHGDPEVKFVWWIPSLFSHQSNLYKLLKPPDPDAFMTPPIFGPQKQVAFFGTPQKMPTLTSKPHRAPKNRPNSGRSRTDAGPSDLFRGRVYKMAPPCSLPVRVKKSHIN